ncbi:MAG: hypothetical protein HUU49_03315 [Candidatus Buchananbacteria bacterium]|nr:hypothetical protein [Candidatus Buchananbacteria bacterium]
MLSEIAIKEFVAIYYKRYGVTLTQEQAREAAFKLLNMFQVIYRPIGKDGVKLVNTKESDGSS